jgi:hypothetical protein
MKQASILGNPCIVDPRNIRHTVCPQTDIALSRTAAWFMHEHGIPPIA